MTPLSPAVADAAPPFPPDPPLPLEPFPPLPPAPPLAVALFEPSELVALAVAVPPGPPAPPVVPRYRRFRWLRSPYPTPPKLVVRRMRRGNRPRKSVAVRGMARRKCRGITGRAEMTHTRGGSILTQCTPAFNIGGERNNNAVEASVEVKQADTASGRRLAGENGVVAGGSNERAGQSRATAQPKVSRTKQANSINRFPRDAVRLVSRAVP